MAIVYHRPAPPLDRYVRAIFFRDTPMPGPRALLLPNPAPNLEINLGGSFHVYAEGQQAPVAVCTDSWWAGPHSVAQGIAWPEQLAVLIVEFWPGGAAPFLRFPLAELADQVVDASALWGALAAELCERVALAPTLAARFALVERLLLDRLGAHPHNLAAVQQAVSLIERAHGALSIRALSEHLGVSQKHLVAQCKALVGLTPKGLARIARFRRVIRMLDPTDAVDWAGVAQELGYYDQAHLANDFRGLTGHSPTGYLHLRRQIHDAADPDVAGMLQLPDGAFFPRQGESSSV